MFPSDKDLWSDSGYGKRVVEVAEEKVKKFCMGVSASTSKVHRILYYNKCGKLEKIEIEQECAVNEQGIREYEMVEKKP
ncbi:761_t:CDS:2, partial [Gigaspora margarita]